MGSNDDCGFGGVRINHTATFNGSAAVKAEAGVDFDSIWNVSLVSNIIE